MSLKKIWVATDPDNSQCTYDTEPFRGKHWWLSDGVEMQFINSVIPTQKWEDEPACFELAPIGLVSRQSDIIKSQSNSITTLEAEIEKLLALIPKK